MLKFQVEKWQEQKPDFLGLIIDSKNLFKAGRSAFARIVSQKQARIAAKELKGAILEDGIWISSTEHVKHHDREEKIRILASRLLKSANAMGTSDVGILLNTKSGTEACLYVLQGIALGDYRFDKYKKKDREERIVTVTFYLEERAVNPVRKKIVAEQALLQSVEACRNMVNEPASRIFPLEVAKIARTVARQSGIQCEIISGQKLKGNGYNGLINVGMGSAHPPCMAILRYRPKRAGKKHLALVGKGITFDTGGYCLKPPPSMWEMKSDMAGAATVLYAIEAIARNRVRMNVTAILCLAENMVDGGAYRPGDIFVAKNGKSISVGNTDAEGRLVLTDGLFRAGEEGATHIIDIATLTGAMVVSLGLSITGYFTNNRGYGNQLMRACAKTGELFWELPLHKEYLEMLKSPYADIENVGNRNGGSIQAALFLNEFVPEKTPWIHLDVAGTAFNPKPWKYYNEGATGIGVRTLTRLAEILP